MGLRSLDVLQQLPRLSDQRLNLFPLFDRAPRKQAMLERVLVLLRRARPRRARGLAPFDAVPELLLGGKQQMLVERIGWDCHFDPLPAPGNDRQHRSS